MKKIVIFILFLIAISAFATNIKNAGTSQYFDYSTAKTVNLLTETDDNGNVYIDTSKYIYTLSTEDKTDFVKLLNEGLRLINVAFNNKTTIDYYKKIGVSYFNDGFFIVEFITSGYENSELVISSYSSGKNLVMNFSKKATEDLISILGKATIVASDIQNQIKLFQ